MNGMNFLDLVKARYSVRSYRPQAVEREKVEYLLECARLAPSAVNFQPWRFFVVASDARREALRALLSPRVGSPKRRSASHGQVRRRVGVVEA